MQRHTPSSLIESLEARTLLSDWQVLGVETDLDALIGSDAGAERITDPGMHGGVLPGEPSPSDIGTLRAGSPLSSLTIGDVRYVAGINQFDQAVVFRQGDAGWLVRRMGDTQVDANAEVLLVADPGGDEPTLVVSSDGALFVFEVDAGSEAEAEALSGFDGRTAIVRGMTTFTNAEGVAHIAGFDVEGDLVIYYRNTGESIVDAVGWRFDNLSQTHLQPQEIPTPAIVSDLTAYTTSWSGMNIAGLDDAGHVHAIWWSPESVFWKATDLSMAAEGGVVTFVGNITAFVSPWETIHIAGTPDTTSGPAVLWWAPVFGGAWQYNTISTVDGPRVEPGSLTSYVAPWGGLNVAGHSEQGDVVVYWWSPEAMQWVSEPLGNGSVDIGGRLSSLVELGDPVTQNIYGRELDGSLMHLAWNPGDADWVFENVTDELS
jgi:hypothetical protein